MQPQWDPWYKATLSHPFENTLKLDVPHDVFSTQQIDEGTLLLLENLPSFNPSAVLDMGCGYGALGLPIAIRFPNSQVTLIDRDLLAVNWSLLNAKKNKLLNVEAYGSLGFRNVPDQTLYDWVLCNVPARIGRPFIENFIEVGRSRLTPKGDLRVVVIRDLAHILLELKNEKKWDLIEIARGPRHVVFSIGSEKTYPGDSPDLYFRDEVTLEGLLFDRPFDLGGDDPKRLKSGLPALIETLPRRDTLEKVFCFRCGYGQLPLVSLKRWSSAKVVAVDRDLLATEFTRRNFKKNNFGRDQIEIREEAHFPKAIFEEEKFDLILGELLPSAGEKVAQSEFQAVLRALKPEGQALLLTLDKLNREWIQPYVVKERISAFPLLSREGYTVLSLSGRSR